MADLDDGDLDEALLGALNSKRSRRKRDEVSSSDDDVDLSDDDEPENKRSRGRPPRGRAGSDEPRGIDGDDLFEDDADRARLEGMTELEREMILADRAEKADRDRQRRQLLQQARGKDSEPAAEVRASSRRTKAQSNQDHAIAKLQAARERKEDLSRQKEEEQAQKRGKNGRKGGYSEEEELSSEEDSESVVPEDEEDDVAADKSDGERSAPMTRSQHHSSARDRYDDDDDEEDQQESEEATMDDLISIQVKRHKLERWVREPFFRDTLPDCMVRVGHGEQLDPSTGRTVPYYKLMQVVEVKDGSSYKFGPTGQSRTDLHLLLRDGDEVRSYQQVVVSNQVFTEIEFDRWRRHNQREPIYKRLVHEVQAKLKKAENYHYTHEDVKRRVEEKRQKGIIPTNLATEKARLLRLRDRVREEGNEPELENLERQIREVEERMVGEKSGDKRAFGMRNINKRNKQVNFEKALNNVSNRPAGEKDRKGADPFSRRATRSIVYWNTKGGAPTPKGAAPEGNIFAAELEVADKLAADMQHLTPTELIQKLEFDIDVMMLQDGSLAPALPRKLLGPKWAQSLNRHTNMDLAGKTVLSVSDWKRRAGIM